MFFRGGLADLQEPLASAPMTSLGQPNERKYKLIPTFFAFPFPVAIHLFLSPLPARERMKVRVRTQRALRERIKIPLLILKTLAASRLQHPPPAAHQTDPRAPRTDRARAAPVCIRSAPAPRASRKTPAPRPSPRRHAAPCRHRRFADRKSSQR